MTDILLSVPSDDPKLPSWVEVPAAQVTGIPDSPDDIGAATAEQGALADATKVQQVTLTAPLAYALPVGTPANTVHRVTFTQDATGGHTVTYGGNAVAVALTAGASTTVELHPVGAGYVVRYPSIIAADPLDLNSFLMPSERLPNDGTTDAAPIIQRAIDAVAATVATAGPRSIRLPAGRYRLESSLLWKSGVGISGAGMNETILLPVGEVTAIRGQVDTSTTPTEFYDDCAFADFTVDAAAQADPDASSGSWMKGIFIQSMRRARFERVAVKNAMWTGFGMDYLQDVWFISCYAEGNGRAAAVGSTVGAGAGFGIATGFFDTESCRMVNCTAINNKTCGFFTENKSVAATLYPSGFHMVGCYAEGNFVGYLNSGTTGAVVSGCSFVKNLESGAKIARTGANAAGGVRGLITGCTFTGNGAALDAVTTNQCGIQLREMGSGGYVIRGNVFEANGRHGIYAGGAAVLGGPVIIAGNHIFNHSRSGIRIVSTSVVHRLTITNNDVINSGTNTVAGATVRDGITIGSPTTRLTIRNNRCFDLQATKTQLYGIALRGTTLTTEQPVIQDNDLRDNATDGIVNQQIVADVSLIANNIS